MKKLALIVAICLLSFGCSHKQDPVILLSDNASMLEQLAAKEIRRYVYLRSNQLLEIQKSAESSSPFIQLKVNQSLEEQQFQLNTNDQSLTISGGSPRAVLYGAYELAEQIGIRFYLHGDVIPDEKIEFVMPQLDITKKPVFDKRGIQPFHDFPEGPDWWSEQDYQAIVAQLAKMKMNFIGFHTYPERLDFNGQGHKAEPSVWIGKAQDIGEKGAVEASYPVLHFHTYDSTWGYAPMKTSDFSLGLSQIFETDNYGADYMQHVSPWPHMDDENNVLFQEVGNMFGNVFGYAKDLGFTTCIGTETPVIIPQKMKARYGIADENETDVKEIYHGIFKRITETYPLDYYWLWTPENWTWHTVTDEAVAKTEKDIQIAREVLEEMGNPFSLATCGWVLGPPKDRAQFDRILNKDIAFSCINRALGYMPVDPGFDQVKGRSKWAIPWMEDDPDMITSQLWVGRLRKDALDAYRYGCDGLFGIHWRTRILGPNVSSLARASWECDEWMDSANIDSRDLETDDFYEDWVFTQFGISDPELIQLFVGLDSKGSWDPETGQKGDAPLNATNWIEGPGALWIAGASHERLSRYDFIPALENYSDQVQGAGNKERFLYWLNSFKFNKATVATALAIKALDSLLNIANVIDGDKTSFVENEILPKRIDVARQWTEMVTLMLAKFTTNGELGNLANLEMHSNKRLGYLTQHDAEIEKLSGKPLPASAQLSMEYPGEDRVLVFTNPSMLRQDDEFHVRIRVLSNTSELQGKMLWRKLGEEEYQEIPLTHMARNVFEIQVPVSEFGVDFEYYFEVIAGEKSIVYPATAEEINCSVVVL